MNDQQTVTSASPSEPTVDVSSGTDGKPRVYVFGKRLSKLVFKSFFRKPSCGIIVSDNGSHMYGEIYLYPSIIIGAGEISRTEELWGVKLAEQFVYKEFSSYTYECLPREGESVELRKNRLVNSAIGGLYGTIQSQMTMLSSKDFQDTLKETNIESKST